jgi:hypothetical protein
MLYLLQWQSWAVTRYEAKLYNLPHNKQGAEGVTIVLLLYCKYQLMFTPASSLAQKFSIVGCSGQQGTSVSPLPHTSVTYKKEGST